jgi:murein DD-endopeptidase MepM/ murein hydrolase activator NlpD
MRNWHRALGGATLVLALCAAGAYGVTRARSVPPPVVDVPTLPVAHAMAAESLQTYTLHNGETLSGILAGDGIGSQLPDLLLALRQYVDPRRLSAGSEITVRRLAQTGGLRGIDVRLNADSTVRLLQQATGWDAQVAVTPVRLDTVYIAGTIDRGHTLYEALVGDESVGLPAAERVQLVVNLADIFGYKLDFAHDIQPGDTFRVVYAREERPDGTARSRRVLIAQIVNQGVPFTAVYFRPSSTSEAGYYEPNGKSLRLAFRRYPVDFVRITSGFSWHRYHPILGIYRAHTGTDFGAAAGTPVKATAAGTVIFAGRDGGYGNLVELRHWEGYTTRYAHLRGFARGIHRGVHVKEGQVIGYVGQTGLATGPHVHYEIRRYNRPLNPRTVKLPGEPPIAPQYRAAFRQVAVERLQLLDRISPSAARVASTGAAAAGEGGSQ